MFGQCVSVFCYHTETTQTSPSSTLLDIFKVICLHASSKRHLFCKSPIPIQSLLTSLVLYVYMSLVAVRSSMAWQFLSSMQTAICSKNHFRSKTTSFHKLQKLRDKRSSSEMTLMMKRQPVNCLLSCIV